MKHIIKTKSDIDYCIEHLKGLKIGNDTKGRQLKYYYDCKKKRFRRSLKQNSLMWLWLACVYQETGTEPDDLYDYYLNKYAPRKMYNNPETGLESSRIITSSNMNEKQMTEFLNAIDHDVSTEGIQLPYPEDRFFEAFLEKYEGYVR